MACAPSRITTIRKLLTSALTICERPIAKSSSRPRGRPPRRRGRPRAASGSPSTLVPDAQYSFGRECPGTRRGPGATPGALVASRLHLQRLLGGGAVRDVAVNWSSIGAATPTVRPSPMLSVASTRARGSTVRSVPPSGLERPVAGGRRAAPGVGGGVGQRLQAVQRLPSGESVPGTGAPPAGVRATPDNRPSGSETDTGVVGVTPVAFAGGA